MVISKHLVLFFTKGVSLKDWESSGILLREIKLYVELIEIGWNVSFITYGDKSDLYYKNQLKGIDIYCNKIGIPLKWYESLLFLIHRRVLKKCSLIKTNQMFGAEIAIQSAKYYNIPVVVRLGYLPSIGYKIDFGVKSKKYKDSIIYEKSIFQNSHKVITTTDRISSKIVNYDIDIHKINVIPNFINCNLFKRTSANQKVYDIIYVGRITEEKNVKNLLEAIKESDLRALIIGNGPLRKELINSFEKNENQIKWIEKVSNHELPKYMNQTRILVLPSFYEGHPKVLIEAMSCEMTVIASNVKGNIDVIVDGINGFLCETSITSIKETIFNVLNMSEKRLNQINENARQFVKDHYSLDKIVNMECQLYEEIINRNNSTNLL